MRICVFAGVLPAWQATAPQLQCEHCCDSQLVSLKWGGKGEWRRSCSCIISPPIPLPLPTPPPYSWQLTTDCCVLSTLIEDGYGYHSGAGRGHATANSHERMRMCWPINSLILPPTHRHCCLLKSKRLGHVVLLYNIDLTPNQTQCLLDVQLLTVLRYVVVLFTASYFS